MGRLARAWVPAVAAWIAASGCNKAAPAPPAVCSAPQGSATDAQGLASGNAAFAVTFFPPAVAASGTGAHNVILSPYSASAALTMVDVGAAGATDAQLQAALQLPGNGAAVAPAYAALACADETGGDRDGNTLAIANSVWGQQGKPFQSSFLSTLSQGYDAPLQQVDFQADPGAATSAINGWVSTQTQGQIPTLLQPGDLDGDTRLVLVNAVYFKGAWDTAFDASKTAPKAFTLSDGSLIQVPTMDGSVTLGIGGGPSAAAYELAYKGGALAMDFLVPTGSLTDLEAGLTPASLGATVASLQPTSAELFLPKFSFRTTLGLIPVLEGMGVTDLFDPKKADLSGMDGDTDLYVKVVVQQAMVEVDETGTVAAAATAASSDTAAFEGGPVPVVIDHPFLFLIRDTTNGSILFMGQVEDPRAS